jgi:hypothetical protein
MSLTPRATARRPPAGCDHPYLELCVKRSTVCIIMPARLRPALVRTHRSIRRSKKALEEWQKFADNQTAKEFERYSRLARDRKART